MLFSDLQHGPSETIVAELRDYPEWHRGRLRFGVWMIPVQDPVLLTYIDALQRRLADLLHPSPLRQPHLTLFVCGFEQQSACVENDDFSVTQLQMQIEGLHRARGTSYSLPLAAPDSFASAAFIPVGDPEHRLASWRSELARDVCEIRQATYTPHITLGLYRQRISAEAVRRRLSELEAPSTSLCVESLHYATYDTRLQFGPLETRHRLILDA